MRLKGNQAAGNKQTIGADKCKRRFRNSPHKQTMAQSDTPVPCARNAGAKELLHQNQLLRFAEVAGF